MIGDAAIEALSGDKEALKLFESDKSGLPLDGSSAEMYDEGRDRIRKARAAGCL